MNVETREPQDEHYEIVSLCPEHLKEAAALFAAGATAPPRRKNSTSYAQTAAGTLVFSA